MDDNDVTKIWIAEVRKSRESRLPSLVELGPGAYMVVHDTRALRDDTNRRPRSCWLILNNEFLRQPRLYIRRALRLDFDHY